MNQKVSIIILNWNGWKDTLECLESLYQINYSDYNVIIVDNNSEDSSIEKIRNYCEGKLKVESEFFKYNSMNKPINILETTKDESESIINIETNFKCLTSNRKLILIKNDKNYGFAEGNNIGIKYALNILNSDYVLLLNNDTVVDENFLDRLVTISGNDENIGAVCPKMYYYDYNGRKDVIWFAGENFSFWKGEFYSRYGFNKTDTGNYEKIKEVDKVEGTCILIKKNVLNEIGLLDPKYYIYWEIPDLCFRMFKKGFKGLYIPEAKIWHKVSASSKKALSKTYTYYIRNQFFFMKKNANKIHILTFLLYFIGFRFWLSMIIFILYHRNITSLRYYLNGVKSGFGLILNNKN